MAIKNGDKVKVEYTGSLDDGSVFDSSVGKEPLVFVAGSGQLIKGFDDAVIGMVKGQEKIITIESADAYGDSNSQLVQRVPRAQLPPGAPRVGMVLGLKTPDGQQIPARITEVTEKDIVIDLNHPLAGKRLTFKIKIIEC